MKIINTIITTTLLTLISLTITPTDDTIYQTMLSHAHHAFNKRNFYDAHYYYQQLLTHIPHNISLLYGAAVTANELGYFKLSQNYLEQIIAQNKTYKNASYLLALYYLRNQEWHNASLYLSVSDYWWYNEPIKNKTVLIKHDGGFGDAIQFMRYIQRLHMAGAYVIVETPAALIPLFSLCSFIDKIIQKGNPLPSTDKTYTVSTPHLTLLMHDTLNKPSQDIPYLFADNTLILHWQNTLSHDKNIKIGLCWSASTMRNHNSTIITNPRSIPLIDFSCLADISNVSFYSLQKITGTDQINTLPNSFVIHQFDNSFDQTNGRFMDTAAVMKNLDLIITVDTSIAHLAGALGVPVWIIVPSYSDFRWFSNCCTSPWYPTMRIFRKGCHSEWAFVMNAVKQTVAEFVKSKIKQ